MTPFKVLFTLLSVAVLANAQEMCNVGSCVKAVTEIPTAVLSCASAAQGIGELANNDDDDRKSAPKPEPLTVAKDILECVTGLISASLSLPSDCGPCLSAIGNGTESMNSTTAPAPAPAAGPALAPIPVSST